MGKYSVHVMKGMPPHHTVQRYLLLSGGQWRRGGLGAVNGGGSSGPWKRDGYSTAVLYCRCQRTWMRRMGRSCKRPCQTVSFVVDPRVILVPPVDLISESNYRATIAISPYIPYSIRTCANELCALQRKLRKGVSLLPSCLQYVCSANVAKW